MAARAAAQADRLYRKSEGTPKKTEHLPQHINSMPKEVSFTLSLLAGPVFLKSAAGFRSPD